MDDQKVNDNQFWDFQLNFCPMLEKSNVIGRYKSRFKFCWVSGQEGEKFVSDGTRKTKTKIPHIMVNNMVCHWLLKWNFEVSNIGSN